MDSSGGTYLLVVAPDHLPHGAKMGSTGTKWERLMGRLM
jgi:hypothetical protein